jgi:2',3'-cyclic-nucleotide 2'-phosphodiesterase (5'-nucleotidase family)
VSLANNLYNGGPIPLANPQFGKRTLDAHKVFTVDGVKIGVIGITSSIVPQQPPVFARTFSFTQGIEELPGDIAAAKAEGAQIIVVMSELGLAQNIQIGREFPEVDVVLSAHSHELTVGAILADAKGYEMVPPNMELSGPQLARLQKGAAIIVEAGEDLYVGRLDLKIADSKVQNFTWEAIPADDATPEDATVAALVADQEKYFVAGPDFKTHSYLPFAFCANFAPGMGNPVERCGGDVATGVVKRAIRLVDPLDIKVGETEILLHRHDALEGAMNNFIADAFLDTLTTVAKSRSDVDWANLDVISMTNGFRFDTVILPADMVPAGATFRDGREPGDVTLRDLWGYFPTAAALVAADYSGVAIEDSLNDVLANVFSPNPYVQRGGWYLGLSSNISQKVDVVNLPLSTSGSRIVETKIDGKLIDPSKRYIIASCYGHTFPIGLSCRTNGGANMMFYTMDDVDDYESPLGYVTPLQSDGLIDNRPGQGAVAGRAAPDNFVHPIHALRLYLDKIGVIADADYGHDAGHRVTHVNTKKIVGGQYVEEELPESSMPGIVQPPEGIGPDFLKRGVIVH